MKETRPETGTMGQWLTEKLFLGQPLRGYLRSLVNPFDIIAGIIVAAGFYLIVLRFTNGLAAVTNASNLQPWGLFLAWGLFSGVPLSATGFVLGSAVYLFGMDKYKPVLRNAILLGFLGYFFAVVFLCIDLGRPWRIYYPMLVSYGADSVMFLVAWHVALYLSCQALEFSPSALEWLDLPKVRKWALKITIGLTIAGVILSTLHQSALGAMFLLMPGKLHPLWYTPYLPWLFFISSIAAALCMVIVVSGLTRRFFRKEADDQYLASLDTITLGLGKGASLTLLAYFGLKLTALAYGNDWNLLGTGWGAWYLLEVLGFVMLPCFLFVIAERLQSVRLVQLTAVWALLGIVLNRFNVSLIAYDWNLPHRQLFNWKSLVVVLAVVTFEILTYRWIIKRLPVLRTHPAYQSEAEGPGGMSEGKEIDYEELSPNRN